MTGWPGQTVAAHAPLARTDPSLLYLLAFGSALLLALVLIRCLRTLAPRLRLVDHPGRVGRAPVSPAAKVGGLGIALAIALVLAAGGPATAAGRRFAAEAAGLGPILLGAAAMALLGVWDDLRDLRPRTKLLFQTLAALALYTAGVRVTGVGLPGIGPLEFGAAVSLLLTLLWFVGITNAFNLVDGADGVAGGAALTASLGMFVVALVLDQPPIAVVLCATAGAVLGFLYFNFPPATVFLGDAGSLSLGFLLAGLGLASSSKATTVLAIAVPVVSMGLPVLDASLAIARRLLTGRGVATADLGHVHHRLRALGRSPRQVAIVLLGLGAVFALASLHLLTPDLRAVGLAFAIVGATVFVFVQRLRVPEFLEAELAVRRGLRRRQAIARNVAVREAVAQLAALRSWPELTERLNAILVSTEWEEAEFRLQLDAPGPGASNGPGSAGARENQHVWRWSRSGVERAAVRSGEPAGSWPAGSWEVCFPMIDPESRSTGTLRLRRLMDDQMSADLHIFARLVAPEVLRAAVRLRTRSLDLVDRLAAQQARGNADGVEALHRPGVSAERSALP